MEIRYRGYVYDIRTMDEDPTYDNSPEITRMLAELGTILGLPHGQYAVGIQIGPVASTAQEPHDELCRVYWGSHGCMLVRGHEGGHVCACCDCPPDHHNGVDAPLVIGEENVYCVSQAPYYGPDTHFYGEDAPD